jgi:organic radical activating enzyme
MNTYKINEVFHSVQGEGVLAGVPMTFVRFAKCNMRCSLQEGARSPGGFDCDTEFESGTRMTVEEVEEAVRASVPSCRVCGCTELEACETPAGPCSWVGPGVCSGCSSRDASRPWVLLTGGEPGLQVDLPFCFHFRRRGYSLAIETNGSVLLPTWEDHSPELPGSDLEGSLECFPFDHITVSPKVAEHAIRQRWAHEVRYVRGHGQGIPDTSVQAIDRLISPANHGDQVDERVVRWCVDLVVRNPGWRLSVQLHKVWRVR